jgi:pimeloyl-ACP methyl ester carboxylesterase
MGRMFRNVILGCSAITAIVRESASEEPLATSWVRTIQKHANDVVRPTTPGGRQFWGDVHHFQGWRIQENVFTKQFRLIDPDDNRHIAGSFEECQVALTHVSDEQKLGPMRGPAVILIHGLLQSSRCMASMAAGLEQAGYTTVEFDYPSTQVTIPDAARYLDRVIDSLDGIEEIHFVTHSMGGLVVRAYSMEYDDPRIKRVVMLGTPNQGAELADLTHQSWIVRNCVGPSARQLGTRPDGLIPKLPIPPWEFAVIAGSRGTSAGWNPLIPGDDDGTVTVESTRLPGAADFATVCAYHSRLLWHEEAIDHTVNFIRNGRLRTDGEPQPIDPSDTSTASKQ